MDWNITAVATIIASLVAGIVALVTARHAAKAEAERFYPERWFDRKVEAYTKVIESLHYLENDATRDVQFFERHQSMPNMSDEQRAAFKESFQSLLRLIDMGEVLFSEEVAKLLDDVRRVLNDNFDDDAYIAAVSRKKVCADTLVAMRPLAKRDLKS